MSGFFERYPWFALILILLAFGIVGQMETKKEMLHTKQSSWRIWQYYRGRLRQGG